MIKQSVFLVLIALYFCSKAFAACPPAQKSTGQKEACITTARLSFELMSGDYPSGTDMPVAVMLKWPRGGGGVLAGSPDFGSIPKNKHIGSVAIGKPCQVGLTLQRNDIPITDLDGGFLISIKVTKTGPNDDWEAKLFVELDDSNGVTHVWGTGQGGSAAAPGNGDGRGYMVHSHDAPASPNPGRATWKDKATKDVLPHVDCSRL